MSSLCIGRYAIIAGVTDRLWSVEELIAEVRV